MFLLAAAAILVLALVFCVVNKPRKPLFTGTTLIILLLFLFATEMINMGLSTPTVIMLPQGFVSVYMYIDVALIVICIISLVIEVRSIFTTAPKKPEEQQKKKEEIKE